MRIMTAILVLAVAMWCAVGAVAADDDPEARALVLRVRDAAPRTAFLAKATLSSSGGWVREFEMRHKDVGEVRATITVVTAPSDVAGTRFLFLDRVQGGDRQFAYLPKLTSRAVEVMAAARQEPFLGSDFYVSDLVAPDVDAYTYRLVGEETIDGRAARLVEAVPKNPSAEPYARTVLAIDPKELLVLRVQTYDAKGEPFKVWKLEKVEKIDGYWTPLRQTMTNVRQGTTSVLEIREVRYNAELRDELFSRETFTR
jgi:outer membrane lipoprotein-sorting protein